MDGRGATYLRLDASSKERVD
ncbi:17649cfb-ab77-4e3c-a123-72b9fe404b0d [Thermothielavioides terrestris]|uniref:17649cfb-ab77-4e3c-a123-72b9fe404b0d n=1 Tax=Thermothielavioides terrestris TaxID=2587410 RepID=A0A3S4ASW4_9PEZI|nr:17649cfb-ab77-4e3c-a123-72b9fe404b0d [Thermothielavioides terrestris]